MFIEDVQKSYLKYDDIKNSWIYRRFDKLVEKLNGLGYQVISCIDACCPTCFQLQHGDLDKFDKRFFVWVYPKGVTVENYKIIGAKLDFSNIENFEEYFLVYVYDKNLGKNRFLQIKDWDPEVIKVLQEHYCF